MILEADPYAQALAKQGLAAIWLLLPDPYSEALKRIAALIMKKGQDKISKQPKSKVTPRMNLKP